MHSHNENLLNLKIPYLMKLLGGGGGFNLYISDLRQVGGILGHSISPI